MFFLLNNFHLKQIFSVFNFLSVKDNVIERCFNDKTNILIFFEYIAKTKSRQSFTRLRIVNAILENQLRESSQQEIYHHQLFDERR